MKRLAIALLLGLTTASPAQDSVTFRDRAAKGEKAVQTIKGKVEGESLAGIKVGTKAIPSGDIIDLQYETPGAIRLDYPNAIAAEAGRRYDEAIKEYRTLMAVPSVINLKPLKRHFDYKVATLMAAKADGGTEDAKAGVAALIAFVKDNPDCWQRVPATRTIARLQLELTPPNAVGARQAYEDLAAAKTASPEIKAECAFAIVDTLLQVKQFDDAKKKLAELPATDPRVAVYQIACAVDPAKLDETIKKLNATLAAADDATKATVYNLLGDCHRLDPKQKKDALFSYLWVDVIYNQDPVELVKAQDRLADLFKELKDDNRAKLYREKGARAMIFHKL